MAKESMKARDRKRRRMAQKYAAKRQELKKKLIEAQTLEEKLQYSFMLQRLPKNASPVRIRNRCRISGRPRGYMRMFGINRIEFRRLASQGMIPGVKKASW